MLGYTIGISHHKIKKVILNFHMYTLTHNIHANKHNWKWSPLYTHSLPFAIRGAFIVKFEKHCFAHLVVRALLHYALKMGLPVACALSASKSTEESI